MTPAFDPALTLELLGRGAITCTFMVPTMWRALAEAPGFERLDAPRFRVGVVGGAPCPLELRERLRRQGLPLTVGYGMTEAGPMGTLLTPEEALARPDSVGRPGARVELAVRTGAGLTRAPGVVGEVALRGPNVMQGYWRDAAATARAVDPEGWLRTGDIGVLDTEGYLSLVGRRHDMIITGGENVYPAEVEAVLGEHPQIREVCVVGLPHPRWGEQVTAALVPEGDAPELEELRGWAAERLAAYKHPRMLMIVEQLPRNAAGKVLRHALRQRGAPT